MARAACRHERLDGVGVASHVFAHSVGDLNNGTGRAATVPAGARDAQPVGARQSEALTARILVLARL
jgi:hypothetical protein